MSGDPPPRAGYVALRVQPFRALKRYSCPGCDNPVPERTGHVVAWPEGFPDHRRHWHAHCWRIEAGRGGR